MKDLLHYPRRLSFLLLPPKASFGCFAVPSNTNGSGLSSIQHLRHSLLEVGYIVNEHFAALCITSSILMGKILREHDVWRNSQKTMNLLHLFVLIMSTKWILKVTGRRIHSIMWKMFMNHLFTYLCPDFIAWVYFNLTKGPTSRGCILNSSTGTLGIMIQYVSSQRHQPSCSGFITTSTLTNTACTKYHCMAGYKRYSTIYTDN